MDTRQDRLAIMHREDETGPTPVLPMGPLQHQNATHAPVKTGIAHKPNYNRTETRKNS